MTPRSLEAGDTLLEDPRPHPTRPLDHAADENWENEGGAIAPRGRLGTFAAASPDRARLPGDTGSASSIPP